MDVLILLAHQTPISTEPTAFAQILKIFAFLGNISMEKNAYTSKILAQKEHAGTEILVLQLEIALKDSIEIQLLANLYLSVVFPQLLGMGQNALLELAVLLVPSNLEIPASLITNVMMDKSGTQTCFSVYAQKIPDGREYNVLHVEEVKFGIFMKAANAERDISSRGINVN